MSYPKPEVKTADHPQNSRYCCRFVFRFLWRPASLASDYGYIPLVLALRIDSTPAQIRIITDIEGGNHDLDTTAFQVDSFSSWNPIQLGIHTRLTRSSDLYTDYIPPCSSIFHVRNIPIYL